ncbi:hypothetical protein [Nocardiopsis rhodophaea]|uniref:hypothetical protein n=1 Tax=Nocardiopsis rhodophaea TaxID=280238 RepID=UPI0031CF2D55
MNKSGILLISLALVFASGCSGGSGEESASDAGEKRDQGVSGEVEKRDKIAVGETGVEYLIPGNWEKGEPGEAHPVGDFRDPWEVYVLRGKDGAVAYSSSSVTKYESGPASSRTIAELISLSWLADEGYGNNGNREIKIDGSGDAWLMDSTFDDGDRVVKTAIIEAGENDSRVIIQIGVNTPGGDYPSKFSEQGIEKIIDSIRVNV